MTSFNKNLLTSILGRYAQPETETTAEDTGRDGMEAYFYRLDRIAATLGDVLGLVLAHIHDMDTHAGEPPKRDIEQFLETVFERAGTTMDLTKSAKGGEGWEVMAERLEPVEDAQIYAGDLLTTWFKETQPSGVEKQVAAVKAAEDKEAMDKEATDEGMAEINAMLRDPLPSLARGVQGEDQDLVDVCAAFDRMADEFGRALGRAEKLLCDYGDSCGWGTSKHDRDTFNRRVVLAYTKAGGHPWDKRDKGPFPNREEFTAELVNACDDIKATIDNLTGDITVAEWAAREQKRVRKLSGATKADPASDPVL